MEYDQTEVYGGEEKFSFWYIGNQTLEYGEEFHLTISCPLHFSDLPFDSHECRVEFGDDSYGKYNLYVCDRMSCEDSKKKKYICRYSP